MTQKRAIFNPLTALASESNGFKSLSSMENVDVGVCPKCGKQMTRAVIANNDTVFYCEDDRVSTPLPDDQCQTPV